MSDGSAERRDSLSSVEGMRLRLRLVEPKDAPYVFALRTNPAYNAHLSPVSGTVGEQRAWIERYKSREAAGDEFYYVIERRDTGAPCGLVRLYDIEDDRFTWGSWILDESKPPKAALESAVLVYRIGFELLGKRVSVFDVRNGNSRTLSFHDRFGAQRTGQDQVNTYFEYPAMVFERDRRRYRELMEATDSP